MLWISCFSSVGKKVWSSWEQTSCGKGREQNKLLTTTHKTVNYDCNKCCYRYPKQQANKQHNIRKKNISPIGLYEHIQQRRHGIVADPFTSAWKLLKYYIAFVFQLFLFLINTSNVHLQKYNEKVHTFKIMRLL